MVQDGVHVVMMHHGSHGSHELIFQSKVNIAPRTLQTQRTEDDMYRGDTNKNNTQRLSVPDDSLVKHSYVYSFRWRTTAAASAVPFPLDEHQASRATLPPTPETKASLHFLIARHITLNVATHTEHFLFIHLFLDGVFCDEAVHADRPFLSDAVRPVHRLQVRLEHRWEVT